MKPLTGREATEAIALYARLGALDARFNGPKVAAAVRTTVGRHMLRVAVTVASHASVSLPLRIPRSRSAVRMPLRRSTRRSQTLSAPERPEPRPAGSDG